MISTNEQQVAIPDGLASSQAKLVYLSLFVMEKATVSEIQQLLELPKLTILPIIRSLAANDHIKRTEDGYAI
ncbi:MarR family transcriptional regulator [Natrinema sp. HArc-T2]|uniref:MarR family transcriptional regulator n=1 Tax=Natrinema sp. HArc-T2 TaxID=3242701 RepID=UPI00359DF0DF